MHSELLYWPQGQGASTLERAEHDKTNLLINEIVDVAKDLGIYNDEVPLDGPQVLLLLGDIKEQAERANEFSRAQNELLDCVVEEASEVIKAVTKMRRFGQYSTDPETGRTNIMQLQQELGDMKAVKQRLFEAGLGISYGGVEKAAQEKHVKLDTFLRYGPPPGMFKL